MNDHLDELLDARLRDETQYIDDGGFTAGVMEQLPARPSSFRTQRSIIIMAAAIFATVLSYFASGEGGFVRRGLVDLMKLSPVMVLALAVAIGILFMVGGLWAALNRTRNPLM